MILLSIQDLSLGAGAPGHQSLGPFSLDVAAGERIALVSEGRGATALLLPALLGGQGGAVRSGTIWFNLPDSGRTTPEQLRRMKKSPITVLGHDPADWLGAGEVGSQMRARLRALSGTAIAESDAPLRNTLTTANVGEPDHLLRSEGRTLCSDLRLRAHLATLFAAKPQIVVVKGAPAGIDPVVEANYWAALRSLCSANDTTLIMLTAEPTLASELCERMVVFHAGMLVEDGPTDHIIRAPRHPYTATLLQALPERTMPGRALYVAPGAAAVPGGEIAGCAFHPRCPNALAGCYLDRPVLQTDGDRRFACNWPLEVS